MRYFFNHSLTEHAHVFDMLKAADASVHITVSNNNPNNPIRYAADDFVVDPAPAEGHPMASDYPAWLLEAAKAAVSDIVIPYRHRVELSGLRDLFAQNGIRLLTAADLPTMTFIENKPRFLDWAETIGISVSPFLEFSSLEEFEEARLTFGESVSLCIKPSNGVGGVGFRRLVDDEAPGAAARLLGSEVLVIGLASLRRILQQGPLKYRMMLMPYLKGPERSTDIACIDGRLLGAVTRTRAGLYQEVGHDPVSFAMAQSSVEELGLSGLINIQTRCLSDGTQALLEMNTRAAGGIGQAAPSRVNLPALLHRALAGHFPEKPERPDKTMKVAKREAVVVV